MKLTKEKLKKWLRNNFEGQPDCKWEDLQEKSKGRPYLEELIDWSKESGEELTKEWIAQQLYDDVDDDITNCGAPVLSRYQDIHDCWPFMNRDDQDDQLEFYTNVFLWDLESVEE